jgi:hypothetical protein
MRDFFSLLFPAPYEIVIMEDSYESSSPLEVPSDMILKRSLWLLGEDSISDALALRCDCAPSCSDIWTRRSVRQARRDHLLLSKKDQLQRVYDSLIAYRNITTKQLRLTIGGVVLSDSIKHIPRESCM